MNSVLVTGCNRGLGLGLIKHLVKETKTPNIIIATCRNRQKAPELTSIADQHKNVHILELDVKNFNSYQDFSQKVFDLTQEHGLNVLINNAGVSPKFTRVQYVKPEQMLETFTVNTIAPIMLVKYLLPSLQKAVSNNIEKPLGAEKALIVNTSSILGSIELTTDGGLYPYRCSKVALNMATKTLSIDLKNDGILVTCIHPGWVKTDMGGQKAPMQIDDSVTSIIKLLYTFNESHNGGFYQWDAKPLKW